MSDSATDRSRETLPAAIQGWDRFWFSPGSTRAAARIRAGLCLITAIYFIGAWGDCTRWLAGDAPFSVNRTSTFLQAAGLENDARWIVSPLFLIDRLFGGHGLVYRAYLLIGIGLCAAVAFGRGRQMACWALWIVFVGWANRLMLLAGVTEILLSLGLFAAAVAPPAAAVGSERRDWKAGFSLRLNAVQITLFAACTIATMLAGSAWWNGLAGYALLAPIEDRTLGIGGPDSIFSQAIVYDLITHGLVIALPIGMLLCWVWRRSWIGPAIVIAWCAVVAILGSHWLYGLTFACLALSIRQDD